MKSKILLLGFFILATQVLHAQTTSKTWHTRPVLKAESPLLIINGKTFVGMSLHNFYLDTSNVLSLEFVKPENDAVKLYGQAASQGAILLKTKRKIEWISTIDIYKDLIPDSSINYKDVLFSLNRSFFNGSVMFMDKDMLNGAKVEKGEYFYADKWFSSTISIELSE